MRRGDLTPGIGASSPLLSAPMKPTPHPSRVVLPYTHARLRQGESLINGCTTLQRWTSRPEHPLQGAKVSVGGHRLLTPLWESECISGILQVFRLVRKPFLAYVGMSPCAGGMRSRRGLPCIRGIEPVVSSSHPFLLIPTCTGRGEPTPYGKSLKTPPRVAHTFKSVVLYSYEIERNTPTSKHVNHP